MFIADADDLACAGDIAAFKQAYTNHLTGMSRESYFPHVSPFEHMSSRLRSELHGFTPSAGVLKKPTFLKSDKVIMLATIAGAIALIGAVIYAAWTEQKEIARKRAVLTDRLDAALKHISKPGFSVTREDGTATSFGRLYVNGKPASQVREELEKITLSNKALTSQEKANCIQVISKSSNQILRQLDDLSTKIKQFDENTKRDAEISAARMQGQVNQIRISQMSMASMPITHVATAALILIPVTMIAWASYRVILWLIKKFS